MAPGGCGLQEERRRIQLCIHNIFRRWIKGCRKSADAVRWSSYSNDNVRSGDTEIWYLASHPFVNRGHELTDYDEARSKTSVPVPPVLAWGSNSGSSLVGIEYIIMEHVPGLALKDI